MKYCNRSISKRLKIEVWNNHFDENKRHGNCPCCKTNRIQIVEFHCAHIKSVAKGGETNIDNLIPCCAMCNLSMKTQHFNKYKKQFISKKNQKDRKIKKEIEFDVDEKSLKEYSNDMIRFVWKILNELFLISFCNPHIFKRIHNLFISAILEEESEGILYVKCDGNKDFMKLLNFFRNCLPKKSSIITYDILKFKKRLIPSGKNLIVVDNDFQYSRNQAENIGKILHNFVKMRMNDSYGKSNIVIVTSENIPNISGKSFLKIDIGKYKLNEKLERIFKDPEVTKVFRAYARYQGKINIEEKYIDFSETILIGNEKIPKYINHVKTQKASDRKLDYLEFYLDCQKYCKNTNINMYQFNNEYINFINSINKRRRGYQKIKLTHNELTNEMILKKHMMNNALPLHLTFIKESYFLKNKEINMKSKVFYTNYVYFMKILYPDEKIMSKIELGRILRNDLNIRNNMILPSKQNKFMIIASIKNLKQIFKNKLDDYDVFDECSNNTKSINKSKKGKKDSD